MGSDETVERLLRRIEQAIYALRRSPSPDVSDEGDGEAAGSTTVVHARVDLPPVLEVAVKSAPPMTLAPSYASAVAFVSETVASGGSWTVPVPSGGLWVLSAVYAGASAELRRTIEGQTYLVWSASAPGTLYGLNLALSEDAPLSVVNMSVMDAPFACELRRLPF